MPAHSIHVTGIVQGVGFRPFVYTLAERLHLTGWVRNSSAGVDIQVEGSDPDLEEFTLVLRQSPPPLAHIDTFEVKHVEMVGYTQFSIIKSASLPGAFQPVSPDVSTCPDCLRELFDPADRRYLYPFINCTNCGPRFTIIEDIPYDRPNTTMASFELCPVCAAEYADPRDRRFHAQPVACPDCGPQVWIEDPQGNHLVVPELDDLPPGSVSPANRGSLAAILAAQRLFADGKILAVKGLGGFHLACDAENGDAVEELRIRKLRVDKPFAVMMPDLEMVEEFCLLDPDERALLSSPASPVVVLRRRQGSNLPEYITPNQPTLGVMLPYTPLHYLLFHCFKPAEAAHSPRVLVMTSGNLSEEPIAYENVEARTRLASLADFFLFHNRPIHTRLDDSVVRSPGLHRSEIPGDVYPIRRARGYAPFPVLLERETPPLLAAGTELKNTFCLARGPYAFISHHIGDMENYETLVAYEASIQHYQRLYRIEPKALACDLHPDYLATRYAIDRAEKENLPLFQVQHHHAHIASCMAENGLPNQPVIGVAFDGTGYGTDGAIWGGEFLLADYQSFQRSYYLQYVPLPGGDAAVRTPARSALAYLWAYGLDWDPALPCVTEFCAEDLHAVRMQLEHRINTPLTSSMGRLFDAVASLCGIRQRVTYEAQAAIELEHACDPNEKGAYQCTVPLISHLSQPIPLVGLVEDLVLDSLRGVPVAKRVAFFMNGITNLVKDGIMSMRILYPEAPVVLSGGVWQNMTLLRKTVDVLTAAGVDNLYLHSQVPTNDGGVSLGQMVVASYRFTT